jgi:hypothetical protein
MLHCYFGLKGISLLMLKYKLFSSIIDGDLDNIQDGCQ